MGISVLINRILIVSTIACCSISSLLQDRCLSYLGHYLMPGPPIVVYKSSTFLSVLFALKCHWSVGVISKLKTRLYSYGSESAPSMVAKRIKEMMDVVEGNIQVALSSTVRPQRSQAPPSNHSLWVSASRQQSFKHLLGAALLPQLPPLLSACRVQPFGLYYLVNPRWCLPKSLPVAICIPQSVGQMLRWLQC